MIAVGGRVITSSCCWPAVAERQALANLRDAGVQRALTSPLPLPSAPLLHCSVRSRALLPRGAAPSSTGYPALTPPAVLAAVLYYVPTLDPTAYKAGKIACCDSYANITRHIDELLAETRAPRSTLRLYVLPAHCMAHWSCGRPHKPA